MSSNGRERVARMRARQRRAAFELANHGRRKRVLATLTWYGPCTCDTVPLAGHPLLQQLSEGRVRDAYTGEELGDLFGMPGAGIREAMGDRGAVPTALYVLHEAMSFDLKFGDDTLSFDPGADLLLCTHTNFWDAIVDRRWIEGKNVGVVILPPFSSDSSPHPDGTIAKLVKATTEGGIATIPSVPEYVSIGLKDIEYSRCTWLSIPVVPYKIPTGASVGQVMEMVRTCAADVDTAVNASDVKEFAASGEYIIKPAVGECGNGQERISVKGSKRRHDGQPTAKTLRKACESIVDSEALLQSSGRKVIVQPYCPMYAKAEFKVWVTGGGKVPVADEEPESRSHSRQTLVAYVPHYADGTVTSVFCAPGEVFSELFAVDRQPISRNEQIVLAGGSIDHANRMLYTYPCADLRTSIDKFAKEAAVKWCSQPGMDTAWDVGIRVDVVAFVRQVGTADVPFYDTAHPVLKVGEFDIIGAGSFCVDFCCPERDALFLESPPGYKTLSGKQSPCQGHLIHSLTKHIAGCMLGRDILEHCTTKLRAAN